MQKNRVIGVILSILLVIVVLWVLAGSVFCVGSIEVVWYNTPTKYSTSNMDNFKAKIVQDSGMKTNESIFTLDRDKYIENIEKENEYIKVLSYEVVWPNNVRINVMEREEFYCVQASDNTYLITDDEFKILRKGSGTYNSNATNCILINGRNTVSNEYNVGEFLPNDIFVDYVSLKEGFEYAGYNIVDAKALVSDISVVDNVLTMNTFVGVQIQILNSSFNTNVKMNTALATLNTLSDIQKTSGKIYVFKNDKDIIESRYLTD